MAISRAQLLVDLLPGLNELFGTEYENYDTTWAVYADHNLNDMTWQVKRIIPWLDHDSSNSRLHPPPFKVKDAKDELDAYKKFMEQTNG